MFNLSISNIAWKFSDDENVYKKAVRLGYTGIEIAPTRIILDRPYDHTEEAKKWGKDLKTRYGLSVSSMQSIWYGHTEKIFGNEEERKLLVDYTKKAVDFAKAIKCTNLVLGCPKNRNISVGGKEEMALAFFKELGDYAYEHGVAIAIEPNPPTYNTNFLNTTPEAISFIEKVGSKGLSLNLDTGAMIENGETVKTLYKKGHLIHHVHISEPGLAEIKKRRLYLELRDFLLEIQYVGYVSIEMNNKVGLRVIYECMKYVKGVFQ